MKKKINSKLIIIFIFLILIESMFTIFTTNIWGNILLKVFFIFLIALFIDFITNIFSPKVNKIIYNILISIIMFLTFSYAIYYKMYENILTIHTLFNSYKAITFISILFKEILQHWYILLIIGILLGLFIYIEKYINFIKIDKKNIGKELIGIISTYLVIIVLILCFPNNKLYSPRNLYFNINNNTENVKQFGLLTTIRLDIERKIFNFKEKGINYNKNGEIIDSEKYNVLNVTLNSDNEEVREIYDYLLSTEPSNKNEYTGLFKDKNIIIFIAESFGNMAIRKDITPTLYKMQQEGINFSNYYAPSFSVGTSDSEYTLDNSLLPADGEWSMESANNNYLYSYPNIFEKLGYNTYAYHDYKYDYYDRNKYISNMGFDSYLACGNGLEERMNCSAIPSDYDMVKASMSDYINDDKFIAYYVTISGHRDYDDNNNIVKKNWNQVKDLNYSRNARAYLASQIELDKALEEVIKTLKENDRLKDTIIVLTGDHYPPGITYNEMQEISSYKLDATFEKYRMPFIIYNSEIEHIDNKKYCSSLDAFPTLLNLLGVDYDSRLLMGRDIFSDSKDLVIFSDRSFITDKGRYNELAESYAGQEVDTNYLENIKNTIYLKYRYSRLILENDFYKYLSFS